ncbi:MAG: Trm112 family protein [Desulfobacteraceae bacterium]
MREILLEMLICPACVPEELRLREKISRSADGDIIEGVLACTKCGSVYPIRDGIAYLDPKNTETKAPENRYETEPLLSSYLWGHYGDLIGDTEVSDAYRQWAGLVRPGPGACLDNGSAVGRFSFEMAKKSDFVVGVDNSVSFVRMSRNLMLKRGVDFNLFEEGRITRRETIRFPDDWETGNTEFVVADAQTLPFSSGAFSTVSSLNIVDKVPKPLIHLKEADRVAAREKAQLLFSDPFSWSTEVALEEDWLGGKLSGEFQGRGLDNVVELMEGRKQGLGSRWKVEQSGHIWWKIRNHSNHFELIRSCFIKAAR